MKHLSKIAMISCCTLALSGCGSTGLGAYASGITNALVGTTSTVAASGGFNADEVDIHQALIGQDPLMAAYGSSVILMFKGQEYWLNSIGHHEGAAKLQLERQALESGSVIDGDAIERHAKLSAETHSLIQESTSQESNLTDQGRVEFAKGWVPYLAGLAQTYYVAKKAGDYATAVANNASSMASGGTDAYSLLANISTAVDTYEKAGVVGTLAMGIPQFFKTQFDTLNIISTYADDQELEKPDDATQALSDMGDI